LPFRGLLRLYTRYGPSIRSTAQGGLCRGASTGTVTRPGRPPATGPTDHCPGGTCTHEVIAPFGAHRILAETLVPGARVSEVARRWQVCSQQVFGWRRAARRDMRTAPATTAATVSSGFVPIITEA